MTIDGKSFILGVIVGGCFVIYKASVQVARDKVKEKLEPKEEA